MNGTRTTQHEAGSRPDASEQPDASAHASAEAFLQGTTVAWSYLQPAERKAIRACCSAGRLQHDRMLAELRLGSSSCSLPSPGEVRGSLQAVVGRGARLQALVARFRSGDVGLREAQLLAALEACGPGLKELTLHGAVPLNGAVADAMRVRCPQLARFTLNHEYERSDVLPVAGGPAPPEYHSGCVQLLTLCGPRLRELRLLDVQRWQTMSYMALQWCTALTSLELQAGWREPDDYNWVSPAYSCNAEGPDVEADVYGVLSQLRKLQALRLSFVMDHVKCKPDTLRTYATGVAQLSALTALTSLELLPSGCYDDDGDGKTWQADALDSWSEAREAHRASLLSALRCMLQLQHLKCPRMWLRPLELPAFLTALTSLTLCGLLPPPGHTRLGLASAPLPAASAPLPPQLRELVLVMAASPRAIAQLQPPPSLVHLVVPTLRFGMSDVDDDNLRAEAVAAVGPAVRTLVACRHPVRGPDSLCIHADGSGAPLLPCEDSPNGHVEWIRQLQGLDVFDEIAIDTVHLSTAELCCLGQVLPNLSSLDLQNCYAPLAALPGLRPHMTRLTRLEVDLPCHYPSRIDPEVLQAVALLLLRPHPGAVQLQWLRFTNCAHAVQTELCMQSIRRSWLHSLG